MQYVTLLYCSVCYNLARTSPGSLKIHRILVVRDLGGEIVVVSLRHGVRCIEALLGVVGRLHATRWEQFCVDTEPYTQLGICSELHALQLSGQPRGLGCPTKRLHEQDAFQTKIPFLPQMWLQKDANMNSSAPPPGSMANKQISFDLGGSNDQGF